MAPVPAAQSIRFADVVYPRTSHSATAPIMKRNGPMTTQAHKIDEAAFGVVYGSITVMALLMGVQPPIDDPGHKAILLFGSVFAVAVAKAYAEICERILQSGHAATWSDVRAVWHHSRTVLLAANGPTLAFLLAALGLLSAETALLIAQILAIGLLCWFGGRIGWRIQGRTTGMLLGAALTGGLGVLVTLLKSTFH